MKLCFKRFPLTVKLILIGIIPLIFFIYLAIQLYNERSQKVRLLANYIDRMHFSADLSMLITHFQQERKYSFDFALNNEADAPESSVGSHTAQVENRKSKIENQSTISCSRTLACPARRS